MESASPIVAYREQRERSGVPWPSRYVVAGFLPEGPPDRVYVPLFHADGFDARNALRVARTLDGTGPHRNERATLYRDGRPFLTVYAGKPRWAR